MFSDFAKKVAPKPIRPFLKHISPAAMKVVQWKDLVQDFSSISKSLFNDSKKEMLKAKIEEHLPESITFTKKVTLPIEEVDLKGRTDIGELFLELYFAQLLCEDGTFIDLRLENFSMQSDNIQWSPSNLQHSFEESFRKGLIELYDGFYFSDPSLFDSGMKKMGLLQDSMNESQEKDIKRLLLDHIGGENKTGTLFKMEMFEKSFDDFFTYLKKHSIVLPSDFVFFGIYLVGLYQTLEPIEAKLDVQKVYQKMRESQKI